MTSQELERALRWAIQERAWYVLHLFSVSNEPYILNGHNGAGPIQIESSGKRVEISISVTNA